MLEGGFFAIESDDGNSYDPANLPAKFAVAGLRVQVHANISSNQNSIHQYGTIIEIISIAAL
jgi:hypothetical protein